MERKRILLHDMTTRQQELDSLRDDILRMEGWKDCIREIYGIPERSEP